MLFLCTLIALVLYWAISWGGILVLMLLVRLLCKIPFMDKLLIGNSNEAYESTGDEFITPYDEIY